MQAPLCTARGGCSPQHIPRHADAGCTVHESQRRLRSVVCCANNCVDTWKGVPQHSLSSRFLLSSTQRLDPEPRWQRGGWQCWLSPVLSPRPAGQEGGRKEHPQEQETQAGAGPDTGQQPSPPPQQAQKSMQNKSFRSVLNIFGDFFSATIYCPPLHSAGRGSLSGQEPSRCLLNHHSAS